MGLVTALLLLTVGGSYFAFKSPTEEELVGAFAEAQRFYAEGAYDQAIEVYADVAQIRSRVLETKSVQVEVAEESYPVQEAALYQTGNAYSKLFQEHLSFAGTAANDAKRMVHQAKADSTRALSTQAFEQVIQRSTSEVLRAQAHGRLVELHFEAEDYPRSIKVSQALIDDYAGTQYAVDGYYNKGWAHFELGEFDQAIAAFEALLTNFPNGYQADRSTFQIGECHFAAKRYEVAADYYRQLVERQNIGNLNAEDLRRMQREKIAGLVDETALELAAKAEIRVGICYAFLKRYDESETAYRRVINLFSTERTLVEEAYLRLADLFQEKGDTDQALQVYREAIDRSSDRNLKARIQYALAERFFAQGQYPSAIGEYRIFLRGYGDVGARVGFSPERVRYRIGSAYQQEAQQRLESAGQQEAEPWLAQAIAQYDTLTADTTSVYWTDAYFNRAVARQTRATAADMALAENEFRHLAESGDDLYRQRALMQLAELHFTLGDFDAAARRARQLLKNYADSEYVPAARMRLALSLQSAQQLGDAVTEFLQVPAESPYGSSAALGAGHVLVGLQRYEEALEVLAPLVETAPSDQRVSVHYLLGQAHSGLETYDQADTQYSAALALDPPANLEQALHLSRGNTALQAGEYAQAVEDFEWVTIHVDDPEKVRFARDALTLAYLQQNRGGDAIAVLDKMLAEARGGAERARLLGRIVDLYYERDQYERTVEAARRLLQLELGEESTAAANLKEKASFLLGDALMRLGRNAQGAAVFTDALERYPASPFALDMRLNLATYYFGQGELETATALLINLKDADLDRERRFLVEFYLANTYYSRREFAAALTVFESLLRDYPDRDERHDLIFGLGECHYQLGQFSQARDYYARLLKEAPDHASADDAQYNTAWSLLELTDEATAMQTLQDLIGNYPQSEFAPAAQFSIGDYAYNRGAYAEAMAAYEAVIEKYPQAEVATRVPRLLTELREAVAYERYELGIAYMDSAEANGSADYYERAISVFKEVRETYPGTESEVGAISNMGVCLEGLGRWKEAVALYEVVMGMYEEKRTSQEVFQFAKSHRDWIVTSRL
jgi:tetratricopeptide (TPR) repeat protein